VGRKVAFKTLGCRLNQFETDSLVTDFYKAGYDIVGFNENADVYIINTCTVTQQGDHKSKTYINQATRRKNGSLTVVTGCMATSQKEYLANRSDITYVVENAGKSQILSLVEAHFKGEIFQITDSKKNLFDFTLAERSFHTRSMIKIQDGCNNYCSYCIVPMVRGRAVSRPADEIISHIKQVIDMDYKEVVLTGVNISRYNYENINFEILLEKILQIPGNFRVRISSIEPEGFGDLFVSLFQHEKLCPHLHLCLQSGSDRILQKMRRTYSTTEFYRIIEKFRNKYPLFNFTTDVLVGFPGETHEDFKATCEMLRNIGFSHVHTFKYSIRKGTRAEHMAEQVDEKVKRERSEIIRGIALENKYRYYSGFISKNQTLLVERIKNGHIAAGYGENYIPIELINQKVEKNSFIKVAIRNIREKKNDIVLEAALPLLLKDTNLSG
jgi:threonylcarbamoyladenosine tRNA methylthiotransferase MtaB